MKWPWQRRNDQRVERWWLTPVPQAGVCRCRRCAVQRFRMGFAEVAPGAICDTGGEVPQLICTEVLTDLGGAPASVVLTSDGEPVDTVDWWHEGNPTGPAVYVEVWGRTVYDGNRVKRTEAGWFDPGSRRQVAEMVDAEVAAVNIF